MAWSMLFVVFGILMLISSDILEALGDNKLAKSLASRHTIVSMVWFALALAMLLIEKATD